MKNKNNIQKINKKTNKKNIKQYLSQTTIKPLIYNIQNTKQENKKKSKKKEKKMTPENEDYIKERYQEVKEKVTYKDFLNDLEEIKQENADSPFTTEDQIIDMTIEKYAGRQNIQQTHPNQIQKISTLVEGNGNISIQGRLLAISNIKTFQTKKGREGKVANLTVEDTTGKIRVVMWTDNMKYMNRIQEGNIIKINNLEVRKGYTGDLEVQMRNNSSIQVLPEEVDPQLPKYEETITNLEDITTDGEYNIIARIKKISTLREIKKEDKTLQIRTLDIMDKTTTKELTLWNKDTQLIDTLDLKEHDTIKIIKARAQKRDDQITLTNSWNGRIIKNEYDIPDFKEEILKIQDATEEKTDITIIGTITKIYDTVTFNKNDGTEGKVKNIEITDETGSIQATLWNKETEIEMQKADIIKIEGARLEYDDLYTREYRVNTGWNASITINPEIDQTLKEQLENIKTTKTTKINDATDIDQDEGREVDIIGRIITISDLREFERDDGTDGQVRSIEIADETGTVRISLWDEKADITQSLGDIIKIENARTRIGQDQMELSVGRTSRITQPKQEETTNIPTYQEIEENKYHDKTISQLKENEKNTKLRVRITEIGDTTTFTRKDGSEGHIKRIQVADETGEIQVALWEEATTKKYSQGAATIIENPNISTQNNIISLSIGNNSIIRQATQEEAKQMPTLHEIENLLYKEKYIEDIEEDDRNIRIKGTLEEINGDKIIFAMCPHCRRRIIQSEEGYICDECGQKIETPNYLMIIRTIIKDETGTVEATFFRKEAETLIQTTTDEVVEIFEQTGDETSMSSKIEDLIGHEITLIGNAKYNEYSEDINIDVKKIDIIV